MPLMNDVNPLNFFFFFQKNNYEQADQTEKRHCSELWADTERGVCSVLSEKKSGLVLS